MAWHDVRIADDGVPKWLQIANILRRCLDDGEFAVGDTMPTEAQLNEAFSISRTTARAALNKLVQDGLVLRRSGVGTVVLSPRIDQPLNQIRGFTEDMRQRGLTPSFEVISTGWGEAVGEATHALGLASNDRPFMIERLLKANGRLIGHSISWIRPDIFAMEVPSADYLAEGSLYEWLRDERDVIISGGDEYIEAQIAGDTTARRLDIEPTAAVLAVTRIARTAAGLPVEFALVTYRSDRYRLRIEL